MDCENEALGGSGPSETTVHDMLPHYGLRSKNAQDAEHYMESTSLESNENTRLRSAMDKEAAEESYVGVEETGLDDDGDKNEKEEGESDIEDYPKGDPNDLTATERELAKLLVSTPRLETGSYDWDSINENASEELRTLIQIKSAFKKFKKSPTELLVKYTRRLKFREHLIGMGWKQKMTITRSSSNNITSDLTVDDPKNAPLPTPELSERDFLSLSETDKVLAKLMTETARLADGRYDWIAIRNESPVNVQNMIDTKSTYSKFLVQPIDYLILHSRRKLFRDYLTFLAGSTEGSRTVMKSKVDIGVKASKRGRKRQATKIASDETLKEINDSANVTRNSSIGARTRIGVKTISGNSSSSDEDTKQETTIRKCRASSEGAGRGLSASRNNKELGKLERELAKLVELTPKLTDKGRTSHDWDEIQRRASPALKKLFESKKHMKSFKIWPLHVLVAEAFKYKFREYREQLRNNNSPAEGLLGNDDSIRDEYTGELLDDHLDKDRKGPWQRASTDDGMAHSMTTYKVLDFSPRITAVNEQFQILSYTPTETKKFWEKLQEIRQDRLTKFLSENNVGKRVAEQMQVFQNNDQEMSYQLVKDFLMPRS